MELAIYLANVDKVLNLEEVLHFVDSDAIPQAISVALTTDGVNEAEYMINLAGLKWLEAYCAEDRQRISRLYFGQEFCEYLMPRGDELEQAYYFGRQLDWDFTYVTGAATENGLAQVRENLEFLAGQDRDIEVVVNDLGVLAVLARDFPRLTPVLGRMLVKQMRLARYPYVNCPPPVVMDKIEGNEQDLRKRQMLAMRGMNLSIPEYRAELERLGVHRVDIDMVPQGVDLPQWDWAVGCYYPWAYVTGGRNCMTAGIDKPAREYVVCKGTCPRTCARWNRSALLGDFAEITVHRANSVFSYPGDYARPYLNGSVKMDRIVFEPYIPIS